MPKIISYTPAWLSSPSPGHEIFTAPPKGTNGQASKGFNSKPGPRRTIARRGTEVFIAVGKEIRWTDLVSLKETWEEKEEKEKSGRRRNRDDEDFDGEEVEQQYRCIKTTVADDIKQLIISPYGDYLAIMTTHTVHIAVLPDSSHLSATDTSPLRLKTFTLGPITHVTTQSAVVSALWHPLGVNGSCIVTVTEDAVVRVWEISVSDRWSFDRPTLAIDLKKLADGTSLDQDFSASVSGINKGFSPDDVEMEVAAACFGGRGSGGWSPMTLWIAMREGDVYALCPLLPEKWAPPSTLIPSLSVSIVTKVATIEDDIEISEQSKRLARQQLDWMSDLDNQEPFIAESTSGGAPVEVFSRPSKPGKVPKLQGPFDFDLLPAESDNELDDLLTDIYVIGSKLDADQLMSGEDEDEDLAMDDADYEGLSAAVVCLLSTSGRVTICLDLDGVEAQWLPNSKSKQRRFAELTEPPSLLIFEVLETLKPDEIFDDNWPIFSHDVNSRYSFFITHSSSITFISLTSWIFRLESELQATDGVDFRVDLLVTGESSTRERIYTEDDSTDEESSLATSIVLRDPDLGYMLLTSGPRGPITITFETPNIEGDIGRSLSRSLTFESEPELPPSPIYKPREVYEPSPAFSANSNLPSFLVGLGHSKHKLLIHEPIRLSPVTLGIFTDVHKILSDETHRLGVAAAELFRRCEQLQIELRAQINSTNELACRIESVTGNDVDTDDAVVGGNDGIEQRIKDAQTRQQSLLERLDKARKKAGRSTGRELSDREKVWAEEVATLTDSILPSESGESDEDESEGNSTNSKLWRRYKKLQNLKQTHVSSAKKISASEDGVQDQEGTRDIQVPSEIRRGKVAQVMALLEREEALVEGAKSRLERLSLT